MSGRIRYGRYVSGRIRYGRYGEHFEDCAALEAILAAIADAQKRASAALAEVAWLTKVAQRRQAQVRAGEWPPPRKEAA